MCLNCCLKLSLVLYSSDSQLSFQTLSSLLKNYFAFIVRCVCVCVSVCVCVCVCVLGWQKVHSSFSVRCYGKIQMNYWSTQYTSGHCINSISHTWSCFCTSTVLCGGLFLHMLVDIPCFNLILCGGFVCVSMGRILTVVFRA